MIKRINIFLMILAVLFIIAGCGGGKSRGPGDGNGDSHPKIKQLYINFTTAIDQYKVDDMLKCLSGGSFTLTISEAGVQYSKTYSKLETELRDDETAQQNWRKSTSESDGHGYVLELVLNNYMFSNETSDGAIVRQNFEVYESAVSPLFSRSKTDNGIITCELLKTNGDWKISKMTIEYQALTASSSAEMFKTADTEQRPKFGFSKWHP